jgi:hypothetical protein
MAPTFQDLISNYRATKARFNVGDQVSIAGMALTNALGLVPGGIVAELSANGQSVVLWQHVQTSGQPGFAMAAFPIAAYLPIPKAFPKTKTPRKPAARKPRTTTKARGTTYARTATAPA